MKEMNRLTKLTVLTEMTGASSRLAIGLAGLVYSVLPAKDRYKVEVLLEAHNDALGSLAEDIRKGKEE